ncbi:MAG: MFS transporter [Alphaproteobacteria bacterium]|nr:MFS transporter [Alphaproteobacteria bacterium]
MQARVVETRSRTVAGAASGPARLSLFYGALFLVTGVQLPFWPVWLSGRGLDAREIAVVFTAAIWAKVLATPLCGVLADRIGRRRIVMAALAGAACVAYAALWRAAGFWVLLSLNLAAGAAQSALMPLGDSVALAAVRERGLDYGRIRVWGSVSFIMASLGSGAALAGGAGALPGNTVLLLVLAASTLLFAACLALPAPPTMRAHRIGLARAPGMRLVLGDRRFWLFVASASGLQASHQLYYGFGTLYWRTLGFSDLVIGGLWAEGVVAEIVLFWHGERLLARFGPVGLMALGGGAGLLRWSLTGIVPGLPAAIALQLLHAGTFGASHLGAMHFMARTVPPQAAASAQSVYAALSSGLGSGIVMLIAGALYAAYAGGAYILMALLSGAGLLGAMLLARSGSSPAQQAALAGGNAGPDRKAQH